MPSLDQSRKAFAERNSGCRVKATMEKSTPAQHGSTPKLKPISDGGIFIQPVFD
jgi:hypothetical protein